MKKTILSFLLIAVASVSALAQGPIVGKWKSDPVMENKNGMKSENVTTLTFNPDGTFFETTGVKVSMDFPVPDKKDTLSIRMSATVNVDGSYVIEGKTLKLKYNYKKAEGTMEDLKMFSTNPDSQKKMDESMGTISKMVANIMVKELRKSYKSESGIKNNLEIKDTTFDFETEDKVKYHFCKIL